MQFRKTDSPSHRLIWYVASTLNISGGGERIIMEGLSFFETQGLDATLLLHTAMPNKAALFNDTYCPKINIIDNFANYEPRNQITIWRKIVQRFRRAPKLVSALSSINPDVIIVNDPDTCRELWISYLISFKKSPIFVTFIHGSSFQFVDDLTKYALIFRQHFAEIRMGDPVYREIIPKKPPSLSIPKRIQLEVDCLVKYLAVRRSQYIFVISQKNQHEIELLYNHKNVAVMAAGGFSRSDFLFQPQQDLKAILGLENSRIILSICRLVSKKRVDLSILAFAELIRIKPTDNCVLVIGGSGPEESNLKALCNKLGIQEKVRFIGQVPESQLRDLYRSCDAFISTDNADYDISVMMALPLGCKVVVSTQYCIPQTLEKIRRFFFIAEPSILGLAQSLRQAINTTVSPLDSTDYNELDTLTWEHYFETILSYANGTIGMNDFR